MIYLKKDCRFRFGSPIAWIAIHKIFLVTPIFDAPTQNMGRKVELTGIAHSFHFGRYKGLIYIRVDHPYNSIPFIIEYSVTPVNPQTKVPTYREFQDHPILSEVKLMLDKRLHYPRDVPLVKSGAQLQRLILKVKIPGQGHRTLFQAIICPADFDVTILGRHINS